MELLFFIVYVQKNENVTPGKEALQYMLVSVVWVYLFILAHALLLSSNGVCHLFQDALYVQ